MHSGFLFLITLVYNINTSAMPVSPDNYTASPSPLNSKWLSVQAPTGLRYYVDDEEDNRLGFIKPYKDCSMDYPYIKWNIQNKNIGNFSGDSVIITIENELNKIVRFKLPLSNVLKEDGKNYAIFHGFEQGLAAGKRLKYFLKNSISIKVDINNPINESSVFNLDSYTHTKAQVTDACNKPL